MQSISIFEDKLRTNTTMFTRSGFALLVLFASFGFTAQATRFSKQGDEGQLHGTEETQMNVQEVLRDLQLRIQHLEDENRALLRWKNSVQDRLTEEREHSNRFDFLETEEHTDDMHLHEHLALTKRISIPQDLRNPSRGSISVPGMNSSFLWIGGEINGTYNMNKGCFNGTLVASTQMCREWANFTSTIFMNRTFNTSHPPGCIYHKNSNRMVFNFAVPSKKTNITQGVRSVCYGANPYLNDTQLISPASYRFHPDHSVLAHHAVEERENHASSQD